MRITDTGDRFCDYLVAYGEFYSLYVAFVQDSYVIGQFVFERP